MKIQFKCEDDHVIFFVECSASGPDSWVAGDTARCSAIGALRMHEEINPDTVKFEEHRIVASHSVVASLTSLQARALNLPDRPPFVFFTDTKGVFGSSGFKIVTKWSRNNKNIVTKQRGAFLKSAQGDFLIPDPIYSIIELANKFDASKAELHEHWKTLAQLQLLITGETLNDNFRSTEHNIQDLQIKTSSFLAGLRIYTGVAFSLSLSESEDGINFDPVLFSQNGLTEVKENRYRQVRESDGMLSDELLKVFQKDPKTGFSAFGSAKNSYLLAHKTFLIVDDDLEAALQVVRQKQRAGAEERRAFATNPRAVISEYLARENKTLEDSTDKITLDVVAEDIESRAEFVFIETPEYANRAIGMELWEKPKFDYIPTDTNTWLPEKFSLEIGGVWMLVDEKTVDELRKLIDDALSSGVSQIIYQGRSIPATQVVRDKLSKIIATVRPPKIPNGGGNDDKKESVTYVIKIYENFYKKKWKPDIPKRRKYIEEEIPESLAHKLYPHQEEGLKWQIKAWSEGQTGVLNADDQGLGKTLQTISFLTWLQHNLDEGPAEKRKPFLIVLPRGLMSVWEKEEKKYLKNEGLGSCIRVVGETVKDFRVPGVTGHDTNDGKARLKFEQLQSAIRIGSGHNWWVLTTYETLTNFQFSFHKVDFSVVVFDEIQKIKNPHTKAFQAASSVKADFRIGLTGTPIENNVVDLWAVMDVVTPGVLGSMKEFIEEFTPVTKKSMDELYKCLFKPLRPRFETSFAQRRLKESVIHGIKRKDYRVYPTVMPNIQANAYETVREKLCENASSSVLKLLHHLRGVSLHPVRPDIDLIGDMDGYVKQSARLEVVQSILHEIQEQNEKALVFIEDLDMQAFYAQWIQSEFGIRRVRVINGTTSPVNRKNYVESFQKHLESDGGFDVMILSPRAAGVGLTLTAATHVIHLSRWWNPSVEEQCNDRIYRIGQNRDVTVHIPLAVHPAYQEHSFDCVLNNLMQRKSSLARAALWPSVNSDFDIGNLMAGLTGTKIVDISEIDNMTWLEFEKWVTRRARNSGDWEVSSTPWSGDAGADAVLKHRYRKESTALVQVKFTGQIHNQIDEKSVNQIVHAKGIYKLSNPQLVVITNASSFTKSAEIMAKKYKVALVCRERLGLWPSHVLG